MKEKKWYNLSLTNSFSAKEKKKMIRREKPCLGVISNSSPLTLILITAAVMFLFN
jgi:hypothetical protein